MTARESMLTIGGLIAGRFEVTEAPRFGGTSEAYVCTDRLLPGHRIVCKIATGTDDATSERFRAQYLKLLRIRSSGTAQAHGFFEFKRHSTLVLEWIDGPDLGTWIAGRPPLSDRLSVLVDIGAALADLHSEGITHGDLEGSGNVVIHAERGAVLIDPYPDVGNVGSEGFEQRTDLQSLASLIERLAPEYVDGVFADLVRDLRTSPSFAARLATSLLRAIASDPPMVLGADETVQAAGALYRDHVADVNQQYQENRILRAAAIRSLGGRIQPLATQFGLTLRSPAVDEGQEEARDQKGSGYFLPRSIDVASPVGSRTRWSIYFPEVQDFDRPWPYPGSRTLAKGEWNVKGVVTREGAIDLVLDDQGVPVFLVAYRAGREDQKNYGEAIPLSDAWLLRCISDLSGAALSL